MNIGLRIALGLLAASMAPGAARADAQALPAGFLACAAESDDARRLACFDAAVADAQSMAGRAAAPAAADAVVAPGAAAAAATTGSAGTGAASATSPASATAAAAATAAVSSPSASQAPAMSKEDAFGRRGDLKPEAAVGLKELESTVAKVDFKPHGELIVTLENGQVWAEIAPNSGIRVKSGDRVRIESGALGSFRLVAPNNRSSKVTRVR